MKCSFSEGYSTCERCVRLGLNCTVEKHRRGRKLGWRAAALPGTQASFQTATPTPAAHLSHADDHRLHIPFEQPDRGGNGQEYTQRMPWANSEGFQPPDLLTKQATKGRYSLQAILNINEAPTKVAESASATSSTESADDPIKMGIVNYSVAMSLFEEWAVPPTTCTTQLTSRAPSFMRKFNPWVTQFDTELHSFHYVRSRSSFLFSAILAAAARLLNPPMSAALQTHTEQLLAESFLKGKKSIEIIHAIIILTYWKDPEDTRAWLFIGYAIRMGMELGLHRLRLKPQTHQTSGTVTDRRSRRDTERLWLLLFLYDRR